MIQAVLIQPDHAVLPVGHPGWLYTPGGQDSNCNAVLSV